MATQNGQFRTLGVLWGLYGILMVGAAAWIMVYNRTLTLMWGAIVSRVANPFAWMDMLHLFLVATVIMALISAALSFFAAFALMGGARSQRTAGLLAAAF